MVVAPALLLNIRISFDFVLIVYLVSQSIYSYNRFKELDDDMLSNPERSNYLKKEKKLSPFLLAIYLFALFSLSFFGNLKFFLFVLFLIFLGFTYTVFFKRLTYKIVGFKNFFVAFSICLLMPFLSLYHNYPLNLSVFLISVFVFTKLFINTSFCDIKDVLTDKASGLKTFAIHFGEKGLLSFLRVLSVISGLPIVVGVYLNVLPVYSLVLLLTIFYNFYYFREYEKSRTNREWVGNEP